MSRTPETPAQRSMRARQAALVRWSREDPREGTAKARAAALSRFEREVDPTQALTPPERLRRARAAQMAHMTAMSRKSSQARSA